MIVEGNALAVLPTLPEASVQTCVTSPPYWGLRDYGVPGQLGLEPTPEEYVGKLVEVFGEVRRVLRADGTLWLNLGDCYAQAGGPGWQGKNGQRADRRFTAVRDTVPQREIGRRAPAGLKCKDLVGIPWRVAFALQAEGWYLRADIVWSKPNPMPESVSDRPTKAHEYVFLMSKSAKYFFDAEAVSEECDPINWRDSQTRWREAPPGQTVDSGFVNGRRYPTRNIRSVWTIATSPFPEAHFATFPTELPRRCILAGSAKGDTVLDPFFGSGTVGLVAESLGRKWVGIELNPEYVEMARRRVRGPLFAETVP